MTVLDDDVKDPSPLFSRRAEETGFSMDASLVPIIVKGATIAIGGLMPAYSIGKIVSKAMEAIGRNPEAGDKLFVPMLLGAAFAEAIAIYALVIAFTL